MKILHHLCRWMDPQGRTNRLTRVASGTPRIRCDLSLATQGLASGPW